MEQNVEYKNLQSEQRMLNGKFLNKTSFSFQMQLFFLNSQLNLIPNEARIYQQLHLKIESEYTDHLICHISY